MHPSLPHERTPQPDGYGVLRVRGDQCLNASLIFSPACLMFELVWSALPSASSCSLSVALPTVSLTLPPVSSALLSTLSSKAMGNLQGDACLRIWSYPVSRRPTSKRGGNVSPVDGTGRLDGTKRRPASETHPP